MHIVIVIGCHKIVYCVHSTSHTKQTDVDGDEKGKGCLNGRGLQNVPYEDMPDNLSLSLSIGRKEASTQEGRRKDYMGTREKVTESADYEKS